MTHYRRRGDALDLCAGDFSFVYCASSVTPAWQFPDRFLPYPAQLGRTDAVD